MFDHQVDYQKTSDQKHANITFRCPAPPETRLTIKLSIKINLTISLTIKRHLTIQLSIKRHLIIKRHLAKITRTSPSAALLPQRFFIITFFCYYKISMITDEDSLRGSLFYQDLSFSHKETFDHQIDHQQN
jgi:hypothetical protein